MGDCWKTEERGQAIAVYSLAPLLGPVIGPACGAWVAQRSTWRWVVCLFYLICRAKTEVKMALRHFFQFWSTTIVDGFIQVLGVFYLQESQLNFTSSV